jgi:uncharacterized membrane protein YkoI
MKKVLALSFCIAMLSLPGVMIAQVVTQSSNYSNADLDQFHGDQKTRTNAIRKVQQSTGGKVVEIRFAEANAMPGFHTVLAKSGKVEFARLDPASGHVAPIDTKPDWMLKWQQKTDVKLARNAQVSLSQAVRTAEMSKGAPAIAAGVARGASNPTSAVHAYNVLIDDHGSTTRVAVDSSTGQVIADPSALEGWP